MERYRRLTSLLILLAATALAGCGDKDVGDAVETTRQAEDDAFTAACIRDGEAPAVCSCLQGAMRAALPDADYQLFVRVAEAAAATSAAEVSAAASLTSVAGQFVGEEERILRVSREMEKAAASCAGAEADPKEERGTERLQP